jgi:hypothetical protein
LAQKPVTPFNIGLIGEGTGLRIIPISLGILSIIVILLGNVELSGKD